MFAWLLYCVADRTIAISTDHLMSRIIDILLLVVLIHQGQLGDVVHIQRRVRREHFLRIFQQQLIERSSAKRTSDTNQLDRSRHGVQNKSNTCAKGETKGTPKRRKCHIKKNCSSRPGPSFLSVSGAKLCIMKWWLYSKHFLSFKQALVNSHLLFVLSSLL